VIDENGQNGQGSQTGNVIAPQMVGFNCHFNRASNSVGIERTSRSLVVM
jgi:hypothetical protein